MKREMTGWKYQRGETWWVQVCDHGRVHRISTGAKGQRGERKADRMLTKYLEQIEAGTFMPPARLKTFEQLAEMVMQDYRINKRKSLDRVGRALAPLRKAFRAARPMDIPGRIKTYIEKRQKEGMANATINAELSALSKGFRLAWKDGLIPSMPPFPRLKAAGPRQGFFEPDQAEAVMARLKPAVRDVIEMYAATGWRKQEILTLRWEQVNSTDETITLPPDSTKNDEPRLYPFGEDPGLKALITRRRALASALELAHGQVIEWVFFRGRGKPVKDFYHAWRKACRAAGCPERLPHDWRRTVIREDDRAGVPRAVSMQLCGHKTEEVWKRYRIVNEQDLSDGIRRRAEARAEAARKRAAKASA